MIPETSCIAGNQYYRAPRSSAGARRIGIPIRRVCAATSRSCRIFATRASRPRQGHCFGCRHRPLHRPVARDRGALAGRTSRARARHLVAGANLPWLRVRTELGNAAQVLAGLAASGVCTSAPAEDSWSCEYAPAELLRLAHILFGACASIQLSPNLRSPCRSCQATLRKSCRQRLAAPAAFSRHRPHSRVWRKQLLTAWSS